MLEIMEGIGGCGTPMERLGLLIDSEKRVAENREELQLNLQRTTARRFLVALSSEKTRHVRSR